MPAQQEVDGWVVQLATGAPRSDIAAAFVHSDEYYVRLVGWAYRTLLRRDPDHSGRQSYLEHMRNGWTQNQLLSSILSSDECFSGCQRGWV